MECHNGHEIATKDSFCVRCGNRSGAAPRPDSDRVKGRPTGSEAARREQAPSDAVPHTSSVAVGAPWFAQLSAAQALLIGSCIVAVAVVIGLVSAVNGSGAGRHNAPSGPNVGSAAYKGGYDYGYSWRTKALCEYPGTINGRTPTPMERADWKAGCVTGVDDWYAEQ